MNEQEKQDAAQLEARRMIYEMIEASMELSARKGPHPLTDGCNCIMCVNRRKDLIRGRKKRWKYRL